MSDKALSYYPIALQHGKATSPEHEIWQYRVRAMSLYVNAAKEHFKAPYSASTNGRERYDNR
jgi:hypothetical protein